jgi:hypothetical protein
LAGLRPALPFGEYSELLKGFAERIAKAMLIKLTQTQDLTV